MVVRSCEGVERGGERDGDDGNRLGDTPHELAEEGSWSCSLGSWSRVGSCYQEWPPERDGGSEAGHGRREKDERFRIHYLPDLL